VLAQHPDRSIEEVASACESENSLIRAMEALRGSGRSLVPYEEPDLSSLEAWHGDNEIFDSEEPEEVFESIGKRGLFRGRLHKPPG